METSEWEERRVGTMKRDIPSLVDCYNLKSTLCVLVH